MVLVLTTQRYLIRRQGILAARKITTEKIKNEARPRDVPKMHQHNTKVEGEVEVCTESGRKVRTDAKDSTNKVRWR